MRIAGLVLVLLTVGVATGCGAKTSSTQEMFTPFGPAAVEAAALKSGTCLALRMDGKTDASKTRCAKHTLDGISVVTDVDRCPVQYNARRYAYDVVVCHDVADATAQWRMMRSWTGSTSEMDRNSILVRNVIVFGGRRARMRALARALG